MAYHQQSQQAGGYPNGVYQIYPQQQMNYAQNNNQVPQQMNYPQNNSQIPQQMNYPQNNNQIPQQYPQGYYPVGYQGYPQNYNNQIPQQMNYPQNTQNYQYPQNNYYPQPNYTQNYTQGYPQNYQTGSYPQTNYPNNNSYGQVPQQQYNNPATGQNPQVQINQNPTPKQPTQPKKKATTPSIVKAPKIMNDKLGDINNFLIVTFKEVQILEEQHKTQQGDTVVIQKISQQKLVLSEKIMQKILLCDTYETSDKDVKQIRRELIIVLQDLHKRIDQLKSPLN